MYKNYTLMKQATAGVLETFTDLEKHYFAEIAKNTKIARPGVMRELKKMEAMGILRQQREANVKFYSIANTPMAYAALASVEYGKAKVFLEKN